MSQALKLSNTYQELGSIGSIFFHVVRGRKSGDVAFFSLKSQSNLLKTGRITVLFLLFFHHSLPP